MLRTISAVFTLSLLVAASPAWADPVTYVLETPGVV
jgi:hypothetical protein